MSQPELPLSLPESNQIGHRREGEGGTRERKQPEPGTVIWRRVHTTERCIECVAEQKSYLDGADGSPHVAWPASYTRTVVGSSREPLCFIHAAPRRHAEGLRPQRSSDPNSPKPRKP